MSELLGLFIAIVAGAVAGAGIFAFVNSRIRRQGIAAAHETARSIVEQARRDAEARLEAAGLEANVRLEAAEARLEEESQARLRETEEQRRDIDRRDKDLRRRMAFADEKMKEVEARAAAVASLEAEAASARAEARDLLAHQRAKLEQIAGLSADEAREQLRKEIELDARRDASAMILRIQDEARERATEEARWITTQAMQRLPLSQYAETTVTVVNLPSDEMKGRIIGREGRNIRAIEMACGIDLIIDDTPGVIILSSFDPARRMVARMAIERLIEDGRIHPARIEEVIAKVREDFDRTTAEQGEAAAFELGLHDLNPRLLKLTGRLRYLTFHGQSLLDHSREVALIAQRMAEMLAGRVEIVKRAGLFHKIGFAGDTDQDRSPTLLSADIAQRLGEPEPVVHCIQALYGAVAPRTIEAVLLQVAEQAVVSRPGAQKEMLEDFLQELGHLEAIATSFPGVKEAHAVRAGKEIRVIVAADHVSDKEAIWLSRDIAARIEKEVDYPGQVRVSVIRETRSVGFAM